MIPAVVITALLAATAPTFTQPASVSGWQIADAGATVDYNRLSLYPLAGEALVSPPYAGALPAASVALPAGFHPAGAYDLTAGPDGRLWFAEVSRPAIGAFDPSSRTVTEYPITPAIIAEPDGSNRQTDPFAITVGPDGAIWFSQPIVNEIGQITTAGTITQFPYTFPPPTVHADPVAPPTAATRRTHATTSRSRKQHRHRRAHARQRR